MNIPDRQLRQTPDSIKGWKNRDQALVCLTAYTASMASLLDQHVDILLVGDSLGMVIYGMDNTLGVTMDMMVRHTQAVMRAAPGACVVADMPYGSYEAGPEPALKNARILMETGCDAVKLEGGRDMEEIIRAITQDGIPVMGHIGLLPQSVEKEGGYKIKGRTDEARIGLIADARAVEEAGAFSFVIEGTIEGAAEEITKAVSIPTIGIGASSACDGQVLVIDDLLGITARPPKFAKDYAGLAGRIGQAAKDFSDDVRNRRFPGPEQVYKK